MNFKVGDFVWDKVTNSVAVVEYVPQDNNKTRYLVRNKTFGGFRFPDQLLHATTDLEGNPLPTTNEA